MFGLSLRLLSSLAPAPGAAGDVRRLDATIRRQADELVSQGAMLVVLEEALRLAASRPPALAATSAGRVSAGLRRGRMVRPRRRSHRPGRG